MYIPPIPPKKATNNGSEFFIEERKYFLNEFLQNTCTSGYLAATPEMQIFTRPQAKVKDSMESMSKQSTDTVLDYYEKTIKVSTYNINEG
jgi:hypothetical protein